MPCQEPYHSRSILNGYIQITYANQLVVFKSDKRDYHNLSEIVGGISHITICIRDHKDDEGSVWFHTGFTPASQKCFSVLREDVTLHTILGKKVMTLACVS